MSNIAIRVENLSKQYRLGQREPYKTLRDALAQAAGAPFRRLRRSGESRGEGASSHPFHPSGEGGTFWALKDVSFEVRQGEAVGIIGRNGAGKSTLLKILSRITKPTSGTAEIYGRVGSLLEVGTGFHPELTGRENVYLNGAILGMRREEVSRKFDEIVAFAEIEQFLDTPVKRYSSGMYVRLAFAVAAYLEPEILLVDEVLAVGDAAFQKKCLGKMGEVTQAGRTVLFVSHNMAAISHLCEKAVLLASGQLSYIGSARDTIDYYEREILLKTSSKINSPHVIYFKYHNEKVTKSDFEIVSIETFDEHGLPKPTVSTWDTVKIRITFWARYNIRHGSAILSIFTKHSDVPLILCSTQPDSNLPMVIKVGYQAVDCEIASLPLSAGEYIVGAGLAIPNKEWLCKEDHLGWLIVTPKDVYKSGNAPDSTRSILATPHTWMFDE